MFGFQKLQSGDIITKLQRLYVLLRKEFMVHC